MGKNIRSLELLRNGKIYGNKQLAMQAFFQGTNDGTAKLSRYLAEDNKIKTLVGFYADADKMIEASGGTSCYTVFDLEGSSADIKELQREIDVINGIIGAGIQGTTLTAAINAINDKIGEGFDSEHTVADALVELESALISGLTVTVEEGQTTSGYLKTYVISQGGIEVGKIDIPKDMVVSGGSLVHGYWSGDTFTEDPEGPDAAIKIEFANKDVIYINTKDLVDFYTASNAAIDIDNDHNTIGLALDENGEAFLTITENGLKLDGVQVAINTAIKDAELSGGDGISIAAKTVKSVAALNSGAGIKNPITVDSDGIKFSTSLDCGFWDVETVEAASAEDIANIPQGDRALTNLVVSDEGAIESLTKSMTFNSISIEDGSIDTSAGLSANEAITIDGLNVSGGKVVGNNGKVNISAPEITVKDIVVENGSTAYNVFEGEQSVQNLDEFNASNIIVDNPSLAHNVFNVYKPKDDAVINVSDSKFNLTVDNSNVLRIANYANATGVTVTFENIDWTYENGLSSEDWSWAGLLIYQPSSGDKGMTGDLTTMKTWTFIFKNCRYNGVKVNGNNFGEHNQVFYLYNVGNDGSIIDPIANGLTLVFE